ncbi:hypothetical protein BGZ63DRAFT_231638 [Mariannaea sp. PMI_226]|nr:hypothetical protein BGZ63DRAFT_231638 [Mariannaea sp. PMI_226]
MEPWPTNQPTCSILRQALSNAVQNEPYRLQQPPSFLQGSHHKIVCTCTREHQPAEARFV